MTQDTTPTERAPTAACEFVPPHEPWTCRVHQGIRTSLDETECDAIRPAKPLTPGQLENLRQADAEGRVPHNRYLVRGLLATLDAERAARAEPGLREALTPDYCDCNYAPIRGIEAGRHLPSCRYGIIEDFLDAALEAHGEPQEGKR